MNSVKRNLLYAGLDKAEYDRLVPQTHHDNENRLKAFSLFSFVWFLILYGANLSIHIFSPESTIDYGIMALFSLVIFALANILPARNSSTTTILCYAFIIGLYAFAQIDSALNPELPAISVIFIMLMGSMLFIERPLSLIVVNIATIVLLCFISFHIKSRRLAFIDLWDSVAFGVISIAAEVTQEHMIFRMLAQADHIRYLSETDVLTGCKNRNCFQGRLPHFPEMCKNGLVCVYIDVNGLHNLNDSQGHEAGDIMLKSVAQALIDAFGPENTYRIGGDEFVVACPDASIEETRRTMRSVVDALSRQGYDISVGIEQCDRAALDMDALIKKTEMGMYAEKEAYYQQEGHERRRRSS